MKLTDKLRRFAAEPKSAQTQEQTADLAFLQGQVVTNPFGSYYLIERTFALADRHGHLQLGQILEINPPNLALAAKDEAVNQFQLEQTLFFDTETTGLAGGTGTLAFLVGVGFISGDQFVVRQYLMRDYHEEAAMLYDIYRLVQDFTVLVSYNGKSFDWPLLKDRFILARFEPLCKRWVHLDLLYPARRLWRETLPDCSLHTIEQYVLKVVREQDIPGSEVPQRYFDFVRTKRGELLGDVIAHNRSDILSLAALMAQIDQIVARSAAELDSGALCSALAKLYLEHKQWDQAAEYLHQAVQLAESRASRLDSLSKLALIYRRQQRWEQATGIWRFLAEENGDIQSCEELAKYYEHVRKDFVKAKQAATSGLAMALSRDRRLVPAFEYRLERLERKLLKQQALSS
jgi:uncharacterized protein YprB with RNaseH-like and TPR domain